VPTPAATSTITLSAGATAQSKTFSPIASGLGGTMAVPATTGGTGTATATLATTNPSGVPAVQSTNRIPASIGITLTPLAYVTVTASATLTFPTFPAFTFVFPAGTTYPSGTSLYLGQYNASAGGWSTLAGPATVTGTTVSFAAIPGPAVFLAGATQTFALFSTSQTGVVTSSAFNCPTSGAPNSVARSSSHSGEAVTRGRPARGTYKATPGANTLLAVSYSRSAVAANLRQLTAGESAAGASLVNSYDYPNRNISMHVISVPTASLAQTQARLRSQAGVQSVGTTGERRYHTTTTALETNDPYFKGFAGTTTPYFETSTIPGEWDMHAIGLDNAYGYSQPGVGFTPNPSALGSSNIKIAIIDTGVDSSHPELASKVAHQQCYITNVAGTVQSTGSFATDEVGHGTDVAGIAGAATNNGLGFTGTGGNAVIYAYRVFPTPDDTCASETMSDDQCSSATQDIASAINDAVTQGVNVISMSLGGGSCTNGVDSDTVEGSAVANAIAHNIIVVAASGNSGPSPVEVTAPGCDTGVIAVGATSLDDGTATGTTSYSRSVTGASTASPVEYVASYSQYGGPSSLRSASAWGIVAPGGDPAAAETSGTANDLHWIEHIWTSTPFVGFAGDQNFVGNCSNDFPSSLSTNPDCRTLIAGTSMSTPHVAGAAALILAVNSTYQNPTMMKQLLCQTADDLGGDTHQGCGRLNVYRAMSVAMHDTVPPP
jgi:hypothetical protein